MLNLNGFPIVIIIMKNLTISILLLFSSLLNGQAIDSLVPHSKLNTGEKLYIHTDKSSYFVGENIWLRGYLLNSSVENRQELSAFIYVELWCDTLVARVKIKDSEDGFTGHIKILDNLKDGRYILRAYTRWMQNFPAEYMFTKEIYVSTLNNVANNLSKSVASSSNIDLQFFPESGRYFPGVPAKIAFKAVGSDGYSIELKGSLFKKDGTFICDIETKHNGMGIITLASPDKDGYYVMVHPALGESKRFDLPAPEASGVSISVKRTSTALLVSSSLVNLPIAINLNKYYIVLSNNRNNYFVKEIDKESLTDKFPLQSLPAGVNSVKIINGRGETLAERLFYIYNTEILNIFTAANKQSFNSRDLATVAVSLSDNSGNPLRGNFSVSVTDSLFVKEDLARENIVSYMELTSEVRGKIENPGYYFINPSPEKERFLDLLLLTQGWRYYYSEKPLFEKELTQSVSGSVSGFSKKSVSNALLMAYAPKIQFQQAYTLDKEGAFTIGGLDFPDSTSFLLGVSGKNGGQYFNLEIARELFPGFDNQQWNKLVKIDTMSLLTTKKLAAPSLTTDNITTRTLNEIRVVDRAKERVRLTTNISPFLQSFPKDQIIDREKLQDWDETDIQRYIVSKYASLFIGSRPGIDLPVILSNRGYNMDGTNQEPYLYVDGLKWRGTYELYYMKVMDFDSMIFLRGAQGAIYGTNNGVILLATRRADQIFEERVKTNVRKFSPLGYQTNVKFYSPKYETQEEKDGPNKDFRNTLYWNPCIKTDSLGKASFNFYTDDRKNNMNVRIEGLLLDGTPFVKDITLKRLILKQSF